MANKLDRFTRHACSALAVAQEKASQFNQRYVMPEHLLLGVTSQKDCMAVKVMSALGVERERIVLALEHTVERGQYYLYIKPRLAEPTKRIIELSVDEARQMRQDHIGTEHLLLGLVRQGESLPFNLLQALGLSLDAVRLQTKSAIQDREAQQDMPESKTGTVTDSPSAED